MSSVYALEPATRGALTLRTSHGPIAVSLWSNESPRAAQNFVQHALNSYYDGVAFHRVVPGVLVQTGDPTGTGTGGESAFPSRKLQRESHGRLKFRRRGLIALVADDGGECRSQFFITLAETPWLNGMHTIFGSVEGNTIFNLLTLADSAQGGDVPPKVLSIEVTDNPFPSLVRTVTKIQAKPELAKEDAVVKVKNRRLLSFANDEDDEDDSGSEDARQRRKKFPTAVPIKSTTAMQFQKNSKSASKPPTEDKIDRTSAARAEFDRLLSRAYRKGSTVDAPTSNVKQTEEHRSDSRVSTVPIVHPIVDAGTKSVRRTGVGIRKERTKQDNLSVRRRRHWAKNNGREDDVLRKLAGFEERLLAARNGLGESKRDASTKTQWFAEPLRLAATTNGPVEDEYVAVDGVPTRRNRQWQDNGS